MPVHFAGMDDQLEDIQVAVIRAGLRREEMRFIQNFGTLAPGGLNRDFSLTWLARAHTRLFLRAHFQISKFSATANWIFSLMKAALPKRRSFICNYRRLAYHLPTFNTHKRYVGTAFIIRFFCVFVGWENFRGGWGALGVMGRDEGKIATEVTEFLKCFWSKWSNGSSLINGFRLSRPFRNKLNCSVL